jgi:hypothetical protein
MMHERMSPPKERALISYTIFGLFAGTKKPNHLFLIRLPQLQYIINMTRVQTVIVSISQQLRRLESIPDLAAIERYL